MSEQIASGDFAVYLAGRREWNERFGSYISRERWWRWTAAIAVVSLAGVAWSNVWLASQSHVELVVHNVDKLGRTVSVERLGPAPAIDSTRIRAQLQDWIVDVRSVYGDQYAVLRNATQAYAWIDAKSDAKAQLDEWFTANNPNDRAKDETVGVVVDNVTPVGSASMWQADFAEEHRAKGQSATISYWRATIKIKIDPPTDDASAMKTRTVFGSHGVCNPEGDPVTRMFSLASTAAVLPVVAMAQQVPAIQATATAAAQSTVGATPQVRGTTTATVPAGLPPPVHQLSASAPLNAKEKASVAIAARWRQRPDKPAAGEDGVVRWVYGSSQPSVVCAPLQVCDIALQPGEVINSINAGDKVRWDIRPAISGSGLDRTTHIVVKPADADLSTSLIVYTNRRSYGIKLIANARQYTPFTAFSYPEDAQAAWAHYGAQVAATDPGAPIGPVQVVQQQNAPPPSQQPTQFGWQPELVQPQQPVQRAVYQPQQPSPPPLDVQHLRR